jgi:hypothetical protein
VPRSGRLRAVKGLLAGPGQVRADDPDARRQAHTGSLGNIFSKTSEGFHDWRARRVL